MTTEIPKALDEATQRAVVENITTFDKYIEFYSTFFNKNQMNFWTDHLTELEPNQEKQIREDYFRLLGLVGILFAQVGFRTMLGQKLRHEQHKWKQRSFLHPYHQLASASYAGLINAEGYKIKKPHYERLKVEDVVHAQGVWGLMLKVKDGTTESLAVGHPTIINAKARYESPRPICLPTIDLNNKLAELNFTGDIADKISEKEFETQVFPDANEILRDYLDLENAVFNSKKP